MARTSLPIPVVPAGAGDVHEWLSFDHGGDTYTFDVTFLSSNWTCIYGDGCPGIGEEPDIERELGCCSWGAHFTGKKDRKRTLAYAALLGDDEWQYAAEAEAVGGPVYRNEQGTWQTHVVDDACIFLNRPGFPTGAGCALHQAALRRGESFLDWKPEVCWQVPFRLDYHRDDNDHLTYILREWKRRDWGAGGDDFHWWCTEDPTAFVGHEAVYQACRADIERLVGVGPYAVLAEILDARTSPGLPHPALNPDHHEVER
ncbi:hypothetical protein [Rhabdothermincola salaria]|uniref:hypothetical protein n=1 Tax=Rhabdothermincola salaria TaxID=2903142 RepID=UPI001E652B5E|nr:hypothetical protein [Rhabdothermincola salaria]MCD9623035.1 hypothetical protein [Rhabdothermincola salaria]